MIDFIKANGYAMNPRTSNARKNARAIKQKKKKCAALDLTLSNLKQKRASPQTVQYCFIFFSPACLHYIKNRIKYETR